MSGRSKFALILASLAMTIPQGVSAEAAPNAKLWNGTWHLNAAKSKFTSSAKQESETRTYDISGDKVTVKSSSKAPSGKEMNFSYTAGYDGKWYPMIGNPNSDRVSVTVVNGREFKTKSQLKGKPSAASTATVSADGKRLVITRKVLRMKGAPTDVLEFAR